jgi:putative copper export protein
VWTIVMFLHVLAAAVWIGGQALLFAAVPVVRRGAGADAQAVLRGVARRYALLAGPALVLLALTGPLLAGHIGVHAGSLLDTRDGRLVAAKGALLVVIVALTAVHAVLGARIARGEGAERLRRVSFRVSLANFGLGLCVLWLAAELATA